MIRRILPAACFACLPAVVAYSQQAEDARVFKADRKTAERVSSGDARDDPSPPRSPRYRVVRTGDFEVTGDGASDAWNRAEWEPLRRRGSEGHNYEARFKMLYSDRGLYVLFDGTDRLVTATFTEDFKDLWTEDVYEFFFWPDERQTVYFEYEISPLGYELPILVPNFDGKFLGWRPWHYEGERKIQKATSARGGELKSGASISGWTAEVFLPYDLLKPLGNVPPRAGMSWRANFYRVDHDEGRSTGWDWARVGDSFHAFKDFGTLVFE
jgi:hypothetical protein